MKISEIMTRDPACCSPQTPVAEAARQLAERDCGMIPVLHGEGRRPVGAVTDRDLACRVVAKGAEAAKATVADCMSTPCVAVSESDELAQAAQRMQERQLRRLVVTDADGACCGVVAQADIARADAERAGEVVREVSRPNQAPSRV